MSKIIPVPIESLINSHGVETARIEFKRSWNSEFTGPQILKTICAFANDLQNLNGGYIIIGIEEQKGQAVLPPRGIPIGKLDAIQKWIRGQCNRLDPAYQPVISPEEYDGASLLVLWCPASETRPHSVPPSKGEKGRTFFVRIGPETVDAERNGLLNTLMSQTARIPFDDRRNAQARTEDLREQKVREFLRDINSGLLHEVDTKALYRNFRITSPANGHDVPRNIGLLFFSEDPDEWFPRTLIEVVQFTDGESGDILEERVFRGGIHEQLRAALSYLANLSTAHLGKQSQSFQTKGWVSYPIPALRESLVNAVYHRSYEGSNEPIKVYLYPDRIEIISYPGPVPGIEKAHLEFSAHVPPVPARNRRIGEFLKELKLAEGRGTGLPKLYRVMRENQSPDPRFDFDEGRTYFRVTLPAHPEFIAISAHRDSAHLKATGKPQGAFERIKNAWEKLPASPTLSAEYIRLLFEKGRISDAQKVFEDFLANAESTSFSMVYRAYLEELVNARQDDIAKSLLKTMPELTNTEDLLQAAILARRAGDDSTAHRFFENMGEILLIDARATHEFAQAKIRLAKVAHHQRKHPLNQRLLKEAIRLLERVIAMETDDTRRAWAWRDLAEAKSFLHFPVHEIRQAFEKAQELLPHEPIIKRSFEYWLKRTSEN